MTVRTFGPQTVKVTPRNAADVKVFHVNGYVPGVTTQQVTFSTPVSVSSGQISFAVDDGGNAEAELIAVVTNATQEVETLRLVAGPSNTWIEGPDDLST